MGVNENAIPPTGINMLSRADGGWLDCLPDHAHARDRSHVSCAFTQQALNIELSCRAGESACSILSKRNRKNHSVGRHPHKVSNREHGI